MGSPYSRNQLRPEQIRNPHTEVEARYPENHRIDFWDPEVAIALYDLCDYLGIPPDVGALCQEVLSLQGAQEVLEKRIRDTQCEVENSDGEASFWEREAQDFEKDKNRLEKKIRDNDVIDIDKLRNEIGSLGRQVAALKKPRDSKIEVLEARIDTLETRRHELQNEVAGTMQQNAALETEVDRLQGLVKELDW